MKSSSIFSLGLIAVAGLAGAQQNSIPSCATSCVNKYATGGGIAGCGQTDVKCICSNADFLNGIACCLDSSCDASGKAAAVKYAQQICSSAGVTVPDQVVCKSSSSSSSASAAASSSSGSSSGNSTATAGANSTPGASGSATTTGSSSGSSSTASGSSASATSSAGAMPAMDAAGGVLGAVMALLFAL